MTCPLACRRFRAVYTGTRPLLSPAIRAGKAWRGRRELAPRCSATQLAARKHDPGQTRRVLNHLNHTQHTQQAHTHSTQHTTHNTQHTTHNTQHTQHATHTTRNPQHTEHTQHTQQAHTHTTHNTQNTTQGPSTLVSRCEQSHLWCVVAFVR